VHLAINTLRYRSRKVFDEVLRRRLRELAGTHVGYGYRRLTVLLRREGWHVNAKRIYRLYREEELIVRTKQAEIRPWFNQHLAVLLTEVTEVFVR
jgi:putative transposase